MANKPYENFVLEDKLEDLYITHVNLNDYITANNELEANAGDKYLVHTYTATGDVEELAMGQGNTGDIEASFKETEYVVGTTQGRFTYYDEEVNKDPKIVDVGIAGLAAQLVNDGTKKIVAELSKTSQKVNGADFSFDNFADAVALLNLENQQGVNIFAFVNPADVAKLRKKLKDDLKYVEAFVRTGYIGTVCGVSIIASKAVTAGTIAGGTKEAVTLFTKKGTEVEQERDADIRRNRVFGRKVAVIALTDETKAFVITTEAGTQGTAEISDDTAGKAADETKA